MGGAAGVGLPLGLVDGPAVDLDDDPVIRPEEVRLVVAFPRPDPLVALGLREARVLDDLAEQVLEVAVGEAPGKGCVLQELVELPISLRDGLQG